MFRGRAQSLTLSALLTPAALGALQSQGEVPAAPDAGGPRAWRVASISGSLNLRQEPSTSAPVLTRLQAGTLLDNLGCRWAEGRAWCDVQPLGGGARGFVVAELLTPAVSPDGSVARGPDTSALRSGRGDFDASGVIPCAERLGQPMTTCVFAVARSGGGYATVVTGSGRAFIRVGDEQYEIPEAVVLGG